MKAVVILSLLALSTISIGCSTTTEELPPYPFAMRQHAPQPVYNRVIDSRPGHNLPERDTVAYNDEVPALSPTIRVNFKNERMEDACDTLAAAVRYSGYCSGLITEQKVNFSTIGTVDEIATILAERSGANIVIDHGAGTVHCLANAG